MMKMKLTYCNDLTLSLLFILLICSAMSETNVPTWSTNTDIKAGTLTVTMNRASYGGYYQTPYSSAFTTTPNVGIALPTIDIQPTNIHIQNVILWKTNLPQSTNMTTFKLNMLYGTIAFRTFRVSYLAVAGTLSYLKVDYLEVAEASLGPLLSGQGQRSITNIKNLGITVNANSNLSIIPYVSGLKISPGTGFTSRQFLLTFAKNNNTSVFWTATCFGATTVTEIVAYMLFYDITLGEATQELFLDYTPITATNNLRDPVNLIYFNSTNMLVGATSFNFTSGFSFEMDPRTLTLTIPSTASFSRIQFSFWSFRKRNCAVSTPYYQKITNLCYDVCPMGYFPINTPTRYCDSCSNYIAQCTSCTSSTVCNACATGWAVNASFNGCVCAVNYYRSSGSCVATCPNGQWGDDTTSTCVASCSGGRFTNPVTQTCVTQCSSPLFGVQSNLMCVSKCPVDFYGNPLTRICVTSCPNGYYAENSTQTCVTQCQVGSFADNVTKSCVLVCSSPTFGDSSTLTCTNSCPVNTFGESTSRTCVAQCPNGFFGDKLSKNCVTQCPVGNFGDSTTKTCVTQCLVGFFGDSSTRTCVTQCGSPTFGDSSTRTCVNMCPANFFGDSASRACLSQCPNGFFGENSNRVCILMCPNGLFGDKMSKMCVTQCPVGYFADKLSRMCVTQCQNGQFGENNSRTCVMVCSSGLFGDQNSKTCVSMCPSGFFGQLMSKLCVASCPDGYYGDNISKTCVQVCPDGFLPNQATKICTNLCPAGTFADNAAGTCVDICSSGSFGDTQTSMCVNICPIGYYGDPTSATCVTMCPATPSMYGQNMTRNCVNSCPSNTYAYDLTRVCAASCMGTTFGDATTNRCVELCPLNFYAYPPSKMCVTVCPMDYFGQDAQKTCVQVCPQASLYRQNSTKLCVSSCMNEQNTYADEAKRYCVSVCSSGTWGDPSSLKCVSSCPTGYFSQNQSALCVQTCPIPYYAESTSKSCVTACPASSIPDNSTRNCISCADGTYVNSATNTCVACDPSCKTCSGSALNCTSCGITRTLNGSECICNSGVQDDNGNCVSQCTEVGCDLCPTENNICTKCKPSFVLSGSRCHCPSNTYYSSTEVTCYSCASTCAICSGPSSTQCTGCHSSQNRQINTTTFTCDCRTTFYAPNNQDTCIKQPSTTCPQNYVYNPTSGYCVEVCGDGKLFELQCDDGNLDNGDGCDSTCKIEANFSCLYGDTQSPSICSYNGQIRFQLIFAEKDMFGNVIKLEYNLIPQLKFYEKFPNFTNSIKISDPTLNIESAYFSSESKTLLVKLTYNETATGKVVSVSYTPTSSPYSHALTSSSYDWPVRVGNGLSLTYYPDGVYGQAQIYDYVTLGIYIGSLFVYVLALFFRKMIGVEIIILIQTQVISLSMLNEIHPILGVLTKDKYAFGYNQFEYLMNLKISTDSESVGLYSVIGFSKIFGENVNVMFFAICVFYFLAILIGLLSLCQQKSPAKKMKEAALILAREIAFGLLLFSLMNMVTSYALETFAGTIWEYEPEYSGTIKIGSIILIAANYGVYGLYFKDSVESYVFYEKRSRFAQLQPLFIATKAILIAAGIALYQHFGLSVLYALMGLQGAYIILVIVLRPFKRRVDLVRSIIVELSLLYVIGSRYVLTEFVKLDQPGDWKDFLEYGLIGEHGLVGFSLLLSLISMIFHLFKANKADSQISPEDARSQPEIEEEKQKQKRSTHHSKSTHYPIQDYLENYLEDEDRRNVANKRKNKLYFENDLKNNSMAQLINISDGEGYDSKRKLHNRHINRSMEIIEMDD